MDHFGRLTVADAASVAFCSAKLAPAPTLAVEFPLCDGVLASNLKLAA